MQEYFYFQERAWHGEWKNTQIKLKNQTDVTINAYIGLFIWYTHFHKMQLHIWQDFYVFSLTFHTIYESLMKNITYQTLKFPNNLIKPENLP